MILIADSGSTKTDWCVLEGEQTVRRIYTKGINPVFQTREEVEAEIKTVLMPEMDIEQFDEIHFFGAGCLPDKIPVMSEMFSSLFRVDGLVEVSTDMLGAAKALAGRHPGIVCIMGTGSNSCFYDGEQIANNVPALGYVLGDEGSGAVLGKLLVSDVLKNQLKSELREKFFAQYHLTQAEIIDRVYRQPFPNRFLAGLSPFLKANLHEPQIYKLVDEAFKAFLSRNVMQYEYTRYKAHFVGSVAYHYSEVLTEAAKELGVEIGTIAQTPMDGLRNYYSERNGIYKNHRTSFVI